MKVFFDTEFTQLHQNTTLISIGLIAENGNTFYAEFDDYDAGQVDDWIKCNVLDNLELRDETILSLIQKYDDCETARVVGNTKLIKARLTEWLSQFDSVEMWGDCLSYDWVLFCQIFGHAFNLPSNVFYIPFDVCTLMKIKGVDPDISREAFCIENSHKEQMAYGEKHNALWDAQIIKACYEKLMAQHG